MKGQDTLRLEATVIKALPNTRFDVMLEHKGRKKRMTAHVSGKMRMHFIRILPGDKVTVELNRYDLSKPRIVYRGIDNQAANSNEEVESATKESSSAKGDGQ